MSSRKLQEDTRRLVGMRDDQGGLDDAKERTTIGPITRVTPINSDGTGGGASTESGEEATSDGSGETGAGDQTGSPSDPGGFDQPGVDVEFAEDEAKDNPPNVSDVFDGIVDGSWGSGEIFTGVDCDTGDCVVINTSGQFAPPPGWDSPETPSDWDGVAYYNSSQAIGCTADDNFYFDVAKTPEQLTSLKQSRACGTIVLTLNEAKTRIGISGNNDQGFPVGGFITISTHLCSGSASIHPQINTFCANPPPDLWPSDNCTQLTQIDGRWQMHPNEPDRITAYEQGASLLNDICSGSNRYQFLPGVDGGVVLWNYKDNYFRYKNPQTGVASFGSAGALMSVVDRGFRSIGAEVNPYIKPAGFED